MRGKNLFESDSLLHKHIEFLGNKNIVKASVNKYTLDYLKERGFYGIGEIPFTIDNSLPNYIIYYEREANYIEYKEKEGKVNE